MNKGVKIGLIVVVVIGLAVGGYFIYKKLTNGDDGQDDTYDGEDSQEPPKVDVPTPKGDSFEATPFKNKGQGDYFRLWVNRYYPKDAKSLDLSKTGAIDNSFIRKAWMKYGVIYKQQVKNWDKIKNEIPSGFIAKSGADGSYNFQIQSNGEVRLLPKRTLTQGTLAFSNNGSWYVGNHSGKWWDSGKQANVKGKNVKASNFYELAKVIDDKLAKSSFTSFTYRNNLDLENNFVD